MVEIQCIMKQMRLIQVQSILVISQVVSHLLPLIIHNGNDKYQHISTWYTLPPEVTTFANAQFQAVIGRLKLRKTDVGGKLLDGSIFHVTGNTQSGCKSHKW